MVADRDVVMGSALMEVVSWSRIEANGQTEFNEDGQPTDLNMRRFDRRSRR